MEAPIGAVEGLPDRPGSLNQLKKLGDAIRDDDAAAYRGLHYNEVWSWCNELVAAAVRDITDLNLATLLYEPAKVSVTGRAKIRQTVREKLLRRRSDRLPSIQDLAGVRVEAAMTLTEQDRVVEAIRRRFGQGAEAVHDLRDGSHSGYRGVHLWVRLDAPRGAWFEVQVRTRLQGQWANMYEALADVLGREIRYGEQPRSVEAATLVETSQRISTQNLAAVEEVQDLWFGTRRSGSAEDESRLADLLERLGSPRDQAERAAHLAHDMDDQNIDRFIDEAVGVLTTGLMAIENGVRSLSQEEGG